MTSKTYSALIMMLFMMNKDTVAGMNSVIKYTDVLAKKLDITISITKQTKYNCIYELIDSGILSTNTDKYRSRTVFLSEKIKKYLE